ncbi:MAG: porin [Geminicoccaceae bacterium]
MRRAALVVGIGSTLVASVAAAAEPDVYVGGYHDEALRAAQDEWLGLSVGLVDIAPAGPVPLAVTTGGPAGLTSFTPRFGGLGLGVVGPPHGPRLAGDATTPRAARQVGIGLNDTSKIAGVDVDWSAKAGVGRAPPMQAGDPSSFVVGGELAVSGVRFDAAYGERATVLGVSGNHMTAGVAYGIGPVDTRVSYSVVSADDETAASLLSVGSRLTLQPGLILQGDVAYAEQEDTGDAATAGVVSLRFNF